MPEIHTEIETLEQLQEILQNNPGVVIIKFSATWCSPCKKIAPHIKGAINNLPNTYKIYFLDIDESLEIYAYFKNKRMVSAIPSMIAWKKGNTTAIPDNMVTSSDPKQIDAFFHKCADLMRGVA
jgi:thioredoxin 1